MPIPIDSKEAQEIRKLIPLATLPISRFESICEKIELLTAQPGELLFKRGDTHNELVYLLSGEVSLQAAGMQVDVINAQNYSGRFALAHHNPRKIDACAVNSLRYFRLNPDWLTLPATDINQVDITTMTGNESDDNPDDWMTTLLNSPIFETLPPANLQKILMSLEETKVTKGTVILEQGSEGEYYYLIKRGQCILSRKPSPNARAIKLAQLRSSDTFGEDALLSDQPVNVSVTALTDLSLLRLSKENFVTLIKTPALQYINANELGNELKAGAFIVDVRAQDAFITQHMEGSVNAPFFSLLMQFKTFDRSRTAIVVCDDGKTSSAAAFLLLRNKFNAKILSNGLNGLPSQLPPDFVPFVYNKPLRKTFLDDAPGKEMEIAQPEVLPEDATREQLQSENDKLKALVQKLKKHYAAAQQEKESMEKRCQVLALQIEQLKEALEQLKQAE